MTAMIIFEYTMRNILLMLVLVPGISIIFAYTKANIWSFWLGFSLCIFLESFILISYCFLKVQKAYRDSFTIRLTENYNMNPQVEYPFPPLVVNDKVYLNRYTEEAFLNNKKEVLKSPAFEEKLEDLTFNEVSCKKEIQEYIEQMQQKYRCLNKFNEALILFGVRIKTISDSALLIRSTYSFAKFQTYFKDNSFSPQFREQERRAFNELKIKLKSPKIASQNTLLGRNGEGSEEIVLPTWSVILSALEKIGAQFQQIEEMRNSNTEMMEMIRRKIFQDYEVLQKEMSDTMRSLQEIRQNLIDLKEQQKNLQKYETKQGSSEDNSDVMYWLKKQYFQFTNLTLRIKQNENSYKRGVQKMRYFSSKITTFYKQQKDRYDSIVITRYISFLDTYSISLEESLRALCAVFGEEGYAYNFRDAGPPKVKEMIKSKNMNEVIAAQLSYHEEYFERADYYKRKINLILDNLEGLNQFLVRLKGIYSELVFNLDLPAGGRKGQAVYFRILYEQLGLQSRRIYEIIDNLQRVNLSLERENQAQLLEMHRLISAGYQKSHRILSRLRVEEGPVRERYRLVKTQLTQIYKQTQEMISSVKYFEQVYQKHQSRVKKILLVSFIQFINYQKKMICNQGEGDYLRKTADLTENALEDNLLDATKMEITEDLSYENQNRLETGYVFSEEYRALLNRFLFVAYTEWSQSQLFRATLAKEIYIALNEDHNESLQEINIEDFQLSGQPPELLWAKELYSEEGEFIIDLNISFRGRILMKISTTYVTFINIPIGFEIIIEEFYSVLRLCFIVNDLGCSWFSFVGEPIVEVTINPKVGQMEINFNSIAKMFRSIIQNKLKESVYPIKKKIAIPLYKKDESYELIQNRFKSGMEI